MSDLMKITRNRADRDDNDVVPAVLTPAGSDIANILIVERDLDCADALETILAELPGIATVQTAVTAGAAFELLDDGSYDVVGFAMPENSAPDPDVIFIGADQPDVFEVELALQELLASFRERVPDAAIVLLCVYPDRYRSLLGGLVDGLIRKDTSARELRALIDDLRAVRAVA